MIEDGLLQVRKRRHRAAKRVDDVEKMRVLCVCVCVCVCMCARVHLCACACLCIHMNQFKSIIFYVPSAGKGISYKDLYLCEDSPDFFMHYLQGKGPYDM